MQEMLVINYNTGVTEQVEGTLEQAKKVAEEGAAYTGQSISILKDGEEVARLPWCGVPATAEDEVTFDFGDYGFYGEWIEY